MKIFYEKIKERKRLNYSKPRQMIRRKEKEWSMKNKKLFGFEKHEIENLFDIKIDEDIPDLK
jgi:hypothetical protein